MTTALLARGFGYRQTAGNADRAVLVDFRRSPAGIRVIGAPLKERDQRPLRAGEAASRPSGPPTPGRLGEQ